MRRVATVLIGLTIMLSVPGSALAASSTCQAYDSQTGQMTSQACSTTTSTTVTTTTSTLPFTGIDVALLVTGGVILVGAGVGVRMASRRVHR